MAITWSDTKQKKISVINVGEQPYNLKDAAARTQIESLDTRIENLNSAVLHFKGTTTTVISDGDKTNRIQIGGQPYDAKNGDVVIYQHDDGLAETKEEEYVWVGEAATGKWQEFGSTGALKALAFKDSASGTYTPIGTVSQPTFSGTEGNISVSGTPAGTISVGAGDVNYTPAGSVSNVKLDTTTVNSITDVGTLPTFSVLGETLTFTPGTLPTKGENTTVATGVSAQPTFTGTGATLLFTGEATTSTGKFTPSGTVSQPTFTGTKDTITVE